MPIHVAARLYTELLDRQPKCIAPSIAMFNIQHILSNSENEDFICDQTSELKNVQVLLMVLLKKKKNYPNYEIVQEAGCL